MNFVTFILGLIVGMLVRDIKCKVLEGVVEVKKDLEIKPETQFLEPITPAEKFQHAKNIDDLIDNFNKK